MIVPQQPEKNSDSSLLGNINFSSELLSPESGLYLSRNVKINGESFDFASDWHFPMDRGVIARAIATLKIRQDSDTFLCLGDVFDAEARQDTSGWVSYFLNELAQFYPRVLYTPGNHDLRSRDNPWESFDLPNNIVMPYGDRPVIYESENNRILIGNLFYDLEFIDPSIVGYNDQDILDFYRSINDGRSLLNGDVTIFKAMSKALASKLSQDIDILLTHTLPHPTLVNFRVPLLTDMHRQISEKLSIEFINDPIEDLIIANEHDMTIDQLREMWNKKSSIMGSNVLDRPEANPRSGLVCMYGHNHRGTSTTVRVQNGALVELVTHQPYPGKSSNWL